MIEGTGPSNQDKGRQAVGVDGATVASGVDTQFPRRPSDELSGSSLRADSSAAPVGQEHSAPSTTATANVSSRPPRSPLAETLDRKDQEIRAEEARQASDRKKFGLSPRASSAAVYDMIELVGKMEKDLRKLFDGKEDSASFERSPDGSVTVFHGFYDLRDGTLRQPESTTFSSACKTICTFAGGVIFATTTAIAAIVGMQATYNSLLAIFGEMDPALGSVVTYGAGMFVAGRLLKEGLKWVSSVVQWVSSVVQFSQAKTFLNRALRVKEPGSLGGVIDQIHANDGFRGEIYISKPSLIHLKVTYKPTADA